LVSMDSMTLAIVFIVIPFVGAHALCLRLGLDAEWLPKHLDRDTTKGAYVISRPECDLHATAVVKSA
jgi:hypothetical protein